MKFTEEHLAKGRKRFLDGQADAKRRIEGLTQADADALGITLDHLRESETMRLLREYAKAQRLDSMEFFWSYIADTADVEENARPNVQTIGRAETIVVRRFGDRTRANLLFFMSKYS